MLVRFLSNLFIVIAGSLLLAACFAFRPSVLGWLALAAGCAALVVLLGAFPVRGRGNLQRAFDLAAMVTAAWMVVAALSLSGVALKWWSLGEAAALFTLGIVGLVSGQLELRAALGRPVGTSAGAGRQIAGEDRRRSASRLVAERGRG